MRELLSHTGGLWRLSQGFQLSQGLDRRRTAEAGRGHSSRVSARHQVGLQQPRISDARDSDSSGHRRILWRLFAAANFSSAGDELHEIISEADIIPNRAAGYRLVKGELKNQEWVAPMVNTTARWKPLFPILDLAKWDAALYTEKLLKRSSLDLMWTPVKLKNGQAQQRRLRLWLVHRGAKRPPVHSSRRILAGIRNRDRPLRRRQLTVVALANLAGANPGKITRACCRDVSRAK